MITIFLVYSVRELDMSASLVGFVMGIGALGAVTASLVSTRLAARVQRRTILVVCMGAASLAPFGLALAPVESGARVVVLAAVFFGYGAGVTAYNIQAMSFRQQLASADMQGRVGAVYRFFAYGALALGGLLAPALAEPLGLRPALLFLGVALVSGWIVFTARSATLR
jgi:MFS family permease